LADAVLACQLTPEQYNFSHSELEKEIPVESFAGPQTVVSVPQAGNRG
jgi:hypothetical protein